VGVWVNAEHLRIDGKNQVIRHSELGRAGRDVEISVMLQLHEHRETRGGLRGEIDSDRGLHLLGLSRRLKVQVEDEVGVRIEPPRHIGRLFLWHSAGLPE
jgi:hypothetical protein